MPEEIDLVVLGSLEANEKEVTEMAEQNQVDLPQGVLTNILAESAGAHSHSMLESKTNAGHSNNMLRAIANKKFDQVDTIEAGAVEKVLQAGK